MGNNSSCNSLINISLGVAQKEKLLIDVDLFIEELPNTFFKSHIDSFIVVSLRVLMKLQVITLTQKMFFPTE